MLLWRPRISDSIKEVSAKTKLAYTRLVTNILLVSFCQRYRTVTHNLQKNPKNYCVFAIMHINTLLPATFERLVFVLVASL